MYREINLSPLKTALVWFGWLIIVAAIVMSLAVPWAKVVEQTPKFHTYYYQALQAATPQQYAVALRQLDVALDNANIVRGNTLPAWIATGPYNDMAFKREMYLAFAQRAETLANKEISSTEVATGMQDLRVVLQSVMLSVYGFWFWQQGGAWYGFYIPFILIVVGIGSLILASALPYHYRVKSREKAEPSPA